MHQLDRSPVFTLPSLGIAGFASQTEVVVSPNVCSPAEREQTLYANFQVIFLFGVPVVDTPFKRLLSTSGAYRSPVVVGKLEISHT
jgi:hypothetical protein